MASSPDRPAPLGALLAIGAAAATAVMLAFGFALEPVSWLMWIAPLPLLLAVPRLGFWPALLTAEAAWLAGTSRLWWYFAENLEMPLVFVAVSAAVFTLLYTAATLLYRLLVRRKRLWLAWLAMPAGTAAVEYLGSIINADAGGQWWSLAYTQADHPALLQLVSVTGIWGLTFLLLAVPTAIATMFTPGAVRRQRVGIAAVAACCLAATLAYGLARPVDQGETIRAAALALPTDEDSIPVGTDKAEALFADYATEITALAGEGIDVLVLPEKIFQVTAPNTGQYLERWSELAAATDIAIVLGLAIGNDKGLVRNAAVWIRPDTRDTAQYHKQHLVLGLEDWMTAGAEDPKLLPGGEGLWAMTICKDLDHVSTMAAYGDANAGLVLAPALDFAVDGWWHSRVAHTRAVEQGFSLVRAGQLGVMTITDASGNVLAEDDRLAVADLPTGRVATVYGHFGDWFMIPVALILLLGVAGSIPRRREATTEAAQADAPEPARAA